MKVVVAGGRDYTPGEADTLLAVAMALAGFAVTEVVHGACPTGIDAAAQRWAESRGLPVKRFPADWRGPLGRGAGPARNAGMAAYGEALVAVPSPTSRGTWDMVNKARAAGLPTFVYRAV